MLEGEWNRHGVQLTHLLKLWFNFLERENCDFHCVCLFYCLTVGPHSRYKLEKQF